MRWGHILFRLRSWKHATAVGNLPGHSGGLVEIWSPCCKQLQNRDGDGGCFLPLTLTAWLASVNPLPFPSHLLSSAPRREENENIAFFFQVRAWKRRRRLRDLVVGLERSLVGIIADHLFPVSCFNNGPLCSVPI